MVPLPSRQRNCLTVKVHALALSPISSLLSCLPLQVKYSLVICFDNEHDDHAALHVNAIWWTGSISKNVQENVWQVLVA